MAGEPDTLKALVAEFCAKVSQHLEMIPKDDHPSIGDSHKARQPKLPLPDPRLIRRILYHRRMRDRFLNGELFADPAWEMLLDLAAARAEHKRVSVTSLCYASGVPSTTALRWISALIEEGLVVRTQDDVDRRRAFVSLSDSAADGIARYFDAIGRNARHLV